MACCRTLFPNDRKITVGALYRPPNADTKPLLDMQDVLQNSTFQDLVIIGDFNLPGIDWLDGRAACDSANNSLLIDIIQDNFFPQLVNEPLENVTLRLTTSPEFVRELAVGEPFSDHFCLTFFLSGSLPPFPLPFPPPPTCLCIQEGRSGTFKIPFFTYTVALCIFRRQLG